MIYSCKTSIIITVAELFPSIPITCNPCYLTACCESIDSTYTIHLFLHTVTVRLFEALKLNGYNNYNVCKTTQHEAHALIWNNN